MDILIFGISIPREASTAQLNSFKRRSTLLPFVLEKSLGKKELCSSGNAFLNLQKPVTAGLMCKTWLCCLMCCKDAAWVKYNFSLLQQYVPYQEDQSPSRCALFCPAPQICNIARAIIRRESVLIAAEPSVLRIWSLVLKTWGDSHEV